MKRGTVCHSLYAGPEKTYGKRCGNNSPTHCVETITPSLVSIYEVSQASHIQDEDITPQYYFKCLGWISPPNCKNTKNNEWEIVFVQYF